MTIRSVLAFKPLELVQRQRPPALVDEVPESSSPHERTEKYLGLPRSHSLSPIMCRDLDAVTTEAHAAPMPTAIFRRVIKIDHTRGILAFFNKRQVACAQ
jgi:hypothetical protein